MTEAARPLGLTPYLSVQGGKRAVAFYEAAFGAVELERHVAEDGERLMHSHLGINGASVMISDIFTEYGGDASPPGGFMLHLQVDDADAWWARAVAAGAHVKTPLADMFWGDRYGQLKDPFGYVWAIGATIANAE